MGQQVAQLSDSYMMMMVIVTMHKIKGEASTGDLMTISWFNLFKPW
jgi:hypothetical protein